MVIRKNLENKYAFISVFNKKNIKYLCKNLVSYDYKLLSTGSTGKEIKKYGFKCKDVSKITNFKEMLDGRVKTLHPKIYSSILYVRDNKKHKKEFLSLKVPEIDIVIVNLYPFKENLKKKNNFNQIEMIDIGGPSLIRAASKNYKYIAAICDVNDYKKLINNLKLNNGFTNLKFRKEMAMKTFKTSSIYDKLIYNFFNDKK